VAVHYRTLLPVWKKGEGSNLALRAVGWSPLSVGSQKRKLAKEDLLQGVARSSLNYRAEN